MVNFEVFHQFELFGTEKKKTFRSTKTYKSESFVFSFIKIFSFCKVGKTNFNAKLITGKENTILQFALVLLIYEYDFVDDHIFKIQFDHVGPGTS